MNGFQIKDEEQKLRIDKEKKTFNIKAKSGCKSLNHNMLLGLLSKQYGHRRVNKTQVKTKKRFQDLIMMDGDLG